MSVAIHDFGKLTTGQPVQLITLKNDKIEVQLLTYAAIIHRIIVPDRKGNPNPYPEKVEIILDKNAEGAALFYPAGDYTLSPNSIYVDRNGSLAIAPRLVPIPKAAARPQV